MNEENYLAQATEAQQELQLIKEMIEKTKQKVVDRGSFFLLWGVMIFLTCSATFALTQLDNSSLQWLPWAILIPIGMIVSIFFMKKEDRRSKYTSYAEHSYNSVWLASGLAFFIFLFVNPITHTFSLEAVYPLTSLVIGIATFASGAIMAWTSLRVGGLFWWGGAVVMMFVPSHFHPLIMAIVIIPGQLIPGYLLKRHFARGR